MEKEIDFIELKGWKPDFSFSQISAVSEIEYYLENDSWSFDIILANGICRKLHFKDNSHAVPLNLHLSFIAYKNQAKKVNSNFKN